MFSLTPASPLSRRNLGVAGLVLMKNQTYQKVHKNVVQNKQFSFSDQVFLLATVMILQFMILCTVIVFNLMAHPSGQTKHITLDGDKLPAAKLPRSRVFML